MKICGLILAAGGSSRLGRPKQLVQAKGKSLLELAIKNALSAGLQKVFVVLGAQSERIAATIKHFPVTIIKNEHWQEGIGSSINIGVSPLLSEGNYNAVLIMLCDQLHVDVHHLQALSEAYFQKKASIIATEYAGQAGVPALFDQKFFPLLRDLSGDTGAKKILLQHAQRLYTIKFEQALLDIDTAEDLKKTGLS